MGAENIQHFTGVRMRIQGTGNLNMSYQGLDDVQTASLLPLVMSQTPGREPFRLANFIGQRVRFRVGTTQINETFKINRMTIFIKPLWSDYPG